MFVCHHVSQAAADSLEELTITGAVIHDEAVVQAIPRVTVTADHVDALQPATTVDLLRAIPGVNVTQQGGPGGSAMVSLRGGDPNFTVVMIDGVQVDDPTNSMGGGFDFVGLDPLLIERVDVYFGSFSAVQGSGALGGTISITTRSPTAEAGASVNLEGGTEQQRAGALQVHGALGDSIEGSVTAVARNGGDMVEGDALDRRQLSVRLRSAPSAGARFDWGLNGFASSGTAEYFPIASGGPLLAASRDTEKKDFEQLNLGARLDFLPAEYWQTRLTVGASRYESGIDSPAIAPGVLSGVPQIVTNSEFRRESVVLSNTLILPKLPLLGFGVEVAREQGRIDSVIDFGFPLPASFDETRDILAFFAEAGVSLGEITKVVATVRHDDVEEITSTNGRIALSTDWVATGTSTSFSYAQGFKLPSLFALGHPLTGNPGLKPETSESFDLTLRQRLPGNTTLALTFYRNKFTDLIDFDAETFSHVNRADATATGVTLEASADLGSCLSASTSVGYMETKLSDGAHLEGRPEWKAGLRVACTVAVNWLVALDGDFNGSFYDVSVPTGEIQLDGYTRFNLSVRRSLGSNAVVQLLVDDVFDERYEEAVGFLNAGRQFRLSLTTHW